MCQNVSSGIKSSFHYEQRPLRVEGQAFAQLEVISNKKGEGLYFSWFPIPYSVLGISKMLRLVYWGKIDFTMTYVADFKSALLVLQES